MAAEEAYAEGIPLMRPLFMEFPDDPGCAHLDRQYMLGADLLVAPVMDPSGSVSFYLPEGSWTHLTTGQQLQGPRWHRKEFSVMEAATWVREGAVLPIGTVSDRPDYDWARNIMFQAFAAPDGTRRITVPSSSGSATVFDVTVRGGEVSAVAI